MDRKSLKEFLWIDELSEVFFWREDISMALHGQNKV